MQIDEYLQSRGYNMKTIYERIDGTSRIEAVERWDGSTDIMMTCGIGTTHEAMMRYPLPIIESDKFGVALCKDIINNYQEHIYHLKQRDEDLQSDIRDCVVEHNQHTHQLHARIDYLEAVNKGLQNDLSNIRVANTLHKELGGERVGELDDCKEAFFKLLDKRDELAATNRGLEQDVENLRISNALYRKRWSKHNEDAPSIPYSIYIPIKED